MSKYIDGIQLRNGLCAAAENLEKHKNLLNNLNVYPVADRDTGVNMALSMKKTAAALPLLGTPAEMAETAYYNMLEYAHGNSGTILTLFFEGLSAKMPEKDKITGRDLALAVKSGADTAFTGVSHPMDGTILSVASQSARAGISMLEFTENAGDILMHIVDEAHACLKQTAFQNPVLQPLGVIDSGAFGFCLMLDGLLSVVMPDFTPIPYPSFHLPDVPVPSAETLHYRFCTELVLNLYDTAQQEVLRTRLEPMGEHFFLIARETLCKIHVHTDKPDEVIDIAEKFGTLKSKKIDDMARQMGL